MYRKGARGNGHDFGCKSEESVGVEPGATVRLDGFRCETYQISKKGKSGIYIEVTRRVQ